MAHLQYAIRLAGDIRTKERFRKPYSQIRYPPVQTHRTATDVKKKNGFLKLSTNRLLSLVPTVPSRGLMPPVRCQGGFNRTRGRIGIGYACHGSQVEL